MRIQNFFVLFLILEQIAIYILIKISDHLFLEVNSINRKIPDKDYKILA